MNEQIKIEEKAHFYTEKKDLVDKYAREKEKLGHKVKIEKVDPKGYVVVSHVWIAFS